MKRRKRDGYTPRRLRTHSSRERPSSNRIQDSVYAGRHGKRDEEDGVRRERERLILQVHRVFDDVHR